VALATHAHQGAGAVVGPYPALRGLGHAEAVAVPAADAADQPAGHAAAAPAAVRHVGANMSLTPVGPAQPSQESAS